MNPSHTTIQIAQHIGLLTIQLMEAQARIAELEAAIEKSARSAQKDE